MGDSSPALSQREHAAVPFWRDIRVLRWVFQLVILAVIIALIYVLGHNLTVNLNKLGLNLSFQFLERPAGFDIREGTAVLNYDHTDTNLKAYLVGVLNTLRAVGMGIVLATLLGTLIGVARLSNNWLASKIALVYTEIMQNTPLLVQLFFWLTLVQALPRQRHGEVAALPGQNFHIGPLTLKPLAYFSQRAAALPGLQLGASFAQWWPFIAGGLVVAVVLWFVRVKMLERQGRPATGQFWWASAGLIITLVIGWLIVPGSPLKLTIPTLEGDPIAQYVGGWQISASFQAILVGLVLYTAAFIAEVVRSGIQSVPFGQIEAATSLGLTRQQRLRLVILPQAMRVIVPPLINQYLNLTKNSSLAIAVGYADLFNVSQTIGNQTGQNTQVIAMVMGTYLIMSLIISALMNFINRRMQIAER